MSGLGAEARKFVQRKQRERSNAASMVAFRLATGIDLEAALASGPSERRRFTLRVERLLERERLRGWARHWSYDLNRHVAIKQAVDLLRRHDGRAGQQAEPERKAAPRGAPQ
jgi:hypothetical protein